MTLAEFYSARLDEIELAAIDATGGPWPPGGLTDLHAAEHIARNSPARVLADVAADRLIIEAHAETARRLADNTTECVRLMHDRRASSRMLRFRHRSSFQGSEDRRAGLHHALQLRAARFADHPGYREEWRP